ncbi:ABC transporter ATP-binding protein [Salmonella enterica]|nr:ABC transporter ATP-binding protein [Salmonella enterica]EKC2533762.1 ABC transporter ATP-binding protein [Salmonella enterica]EMD3382501.1 ABC transporter ATP-binding protein [Salmonella enterica]EMD3422878.1 ABC transporter ATP-binding protein [Salmonella enterica]EMD3477338.1 ABC transporter ATP-binding protein [Salmonella enterica]
MKNFIFISKLIWEMIDARSKIYFYLSILLFILTSILRVSTPVVFSYLISIAQEPLPYILLICIIYSILFCVLRFLEEFRLACYVYFEQVLQKSLILNTLKKYFKLPFFEAKKNTSSETAIIIDRGLGGIRVALYNAIFMLLPLVIECIFLLAIIYYKTNLLMVFEIFLILISFIFFTYFFSSKTQFLQQKWFATASQNYKLMSEGIRAFEALRSFQSTHWMTARYASATDKFILEVKQSLHPGIILGVIQGVLLFILFFFSSYNIVTSAPSTSEMVSLLVLVNGLLLQIALPLLQFSASYRFFIQGLSSARQLFDVMTLPSTNEKVEHSINNSIDGFDISHVSVLHQEQTSIVYDNIFIPEESITIISGASGVGKSSLAKILAGISEYSGLIQTKFSVDEIFYLHQNVDIFDVSLRENIILGNEFEQHKFDTCMTSAGFTATELIALSDRNLGEQGTNISGGQAQRIGLARMLYHGAKVMIFDEPTTGLDDAAIVKVLGTIQQASADRTTIIVTHDARVKDIGDHFIVL